MKRTPILPDELRRAPWVEGGRDANGIDCLGVVLAVALRLGLNLTDPWKRAVGNGFPDDWVRVDHDGKRSDGDVWLWHQPRPHVAIVADGMVVTAREPQGVVALPPERMRRADEVWRRMPC